MRSQSETRDEPKNPNKYAPPRPIPTVGDAL